MRAAVGTVLRVLAAEGPAAVRDRFLDRVEDWRRRRRFRPGGADARRPPITARVLNILPTPPSVRLGGIQIQFLRRLRLEAAARACAVLYPDDHGYRLEVQHGGRREAARLIAPPPAPPPALDDRAFEAAVLRAAERAGARAIHVEGLAGLPAESLVTAARAGLKLVVTLHDFSLFCARPHLIEQPASRFCQYCQDLQRCQACLGHDWAVPDEFQRRYRDVGARLLQAAEAVIYPSAFLRSRFADLVPDLDPDAQHVIEPGALDPGGEPNPPVQARAASRVVRHVALVGAVRVQKGAGVFEQVVEHLARDAAPALRFSVFGGGDADLLRRLRRLPRVHVRGYYRAGSLPRLLRAQRVDLALLLSTSPESYGLTLDECLTAGVPVIAFDHGAVAERVRRVGGGLLVRPADDWRGVLEALRGAVDGQAPAVDREVRRRLPHVEDAARAHLDLYGRLGLA